MNKPESQWTVSTISISIPKTAHANGEKEACNRKGNVKADTHTNGAN